jgi:hypothetical protein
MVVRLVLVSDYHISRMRQEYVINTQAQTQKLSAEEEGEGGMFQFLYSFLFSFPVSRLQFVRKTAVVSIDFLSFFFFFPPSK